MFCFHLLVLDGHFGLSAMTSQATTEGDRLRHPLARWFLPWASHRVCKNILFWKNIYINNFLGIYIFIHFQNTFYFRICIYLYSKKISYSDKNRKSFFQKKKYLYLYIYINRYVLKNLFFFQKKIFFLNIYIHKLIFWKIFYSEKVYIKIFFGYLYIYFSRRIYIYMYSSVYHSVSMVCVCVHSVHEGVCVHSVRLYLCVRPLASHVLSLGRQLCVKGRSYPLISCFHAHLMLLLYEWFWTF